MVVHIVKKLYCQNFNTKLDMQNFILNKIIDDRFNDIKYIGSLKTLTIRELRKILYNGDGSIKSDTVRVDYSNMLNNLGDNLDYCIIYKD